MTKNVFVFLFNGFSDWEISFLAPEINKSKEFNLIYFSKDGNPVTSMGGLHILPNISMAEINVNDVCMLVLPGGAAWEESENNEIDVLVHKLFADKKPIAAICSATIYLGRQGFLDNVKHTSNALFYLKKLAPQYLGEKIYVNSFAVADDNIITANGIAPIEFAREIFDKIKLHSKIDIEKWFQLFKNGIWSE